jgi:glycosyltransferase involved in cell wall biosynthesis
MRTIEHVLIIGKVWPEPNSSAAGSRMMYLIRLFQSKEWKVTFACAASESDFSENLEALGVTTQAIQMNDASFDEFVKELNPDMVMFDRFMTEEQFGWRVKEQCPYAMRVLDTEDLHGLREARRISLKKGRDYMSSELHNDVARREVASIYRSDLSLIISKAEMFMLKKHLEMNMNMVHYLPLLTGKKEFSSSVKYADRQGFITIGNFLHEPNWDAVLHLKNSIWPHIRSELPDAELRIFGAYPSQKVQQLHKEEEGFMIMGRAEDAKEEIGKARIMLAPLRFGAGLKGKLLDAMESGTPSVTTTIGAEGMHSGRDWPGVVENIPIQFAKAAVELYQDEKRWTEAQSNINPILSELFHIDKHADLFLDKLEKVNCDLLHHRTKNFTGSMLWHHTLAGTKYMGKWIEEKNKSK